MFWPNVTFENPSKFCLQHVFVVYMFVRQLCSCKIILRMLLVRFWNRSQSERASIPSFLAIRCNQHIDEMQIHPRLTANSTYFSYDYLPGFWKILAHWSTSLGCSSLNSQQGWFPLRSKQCWARRCVLILKKQTRGDDWESRGSIKGACKVLDGKNGQPQSIVAWNIVVT